TVPKTLAVPAGGDASFEITLDARAVPLGQVRHATIELRFAQRVLHMPVTIVRNQAVVPFTKTCSPATFPIGRTTSCTISSTNTSSASANVTNTDPVPNDLEIVSGAVVGATQNGDQLSFSGTLAGAQPPNVSIAPGTSPAGGYLGLAGFGVTP